MTQGEKPNDRRNRFKSVRLTKITSAIDEVSLVRRTPLIEHIALFVLDVLWGSLVWVCGVDSLTPHGTNHLAQLYATVRILHAREHLPSNPCAFLV